MTDQFEQLEKHTVIVADTGEIDQIRVYKPTDATTNPSLILKAVKLPEYQSLVDDALAYGRRHDCKTDKERIEITCDRLAVNFGIEILKIVPGLISTEVDARLSFDTEATIARAKRFHQMYKELGVNPKERVLIKVASTWQGIKAGEALEAEGIRCNMTLLFSHSAQAVACCEAGVTLISPFVGRITDWYKKETGTKDYHPEDDPGVKSVRTIYSYYKKHGYSTVVMGASFRNAGQIKALAGCDKLTIAPKFLKVLRENNDHLPRKLSKPSKVLPVHSSRLTESEFYFNLSQDPMATEKLSQGIRGFVKDQMKLEAIIAKRLGIPRAHL